MDKSIQTIKSGLAILTFLNIPWSLETAVISGGEPAADYSPLGEKCGEGLDWSTGLRCVDRFWRTPALNSTVVTYRSTHTHKHTQRHTNIYDIHTSYKLGTYSTGLWTSSDVLQPWIPLYTSLVRVKKIQKHKHTQTYTERPKTCEKTFATEHMLLKTCDCTTYHNRQCRTDEVKHTLRHEITLVSPAVVKSSHAHNIPIIGVLNFSHWAFFFPVFSQDVWIKCVCVCIPDVYKFTTVFTCASFPKREGRRRIRIATTYFGPQESQ